MFALMAALSPDAQAAIAPPELAPGVEPALPTTKAGGISDKAYSFAGLVHKVLQCQQEQRLWPL